MKKKSRGGCSYRNYMLRLGRGHKILCCEDSQAVPFRPSGKGSVEAM